MSSNLDGTVISFYLSFTWSFTDNPKNLLIPKMKLNIPYSINDKEQLILNNLKDLLFNKLG